LGYFTDPHAETGHFVIFSGFCDILRILRSRNCARGAP
jgi:hypothetical protein